MPYESTSKWTWLWLSAVLCGGLAAAPAPLAAQSETGQGETSQGGAETETQQFEDWTLRCRPASETQPRACRMHQQAVAQNGGKPVLQFMVGRFGPEKILGAVIFVPIGVRLPPGLGIEVDGRPQRTYSFEICDPRSCQARAVLEGDLLEDLKGGLTGRVKFQNAAGQVLIVPVSLKGFSAALRALP
jgi:invasion protein IalB